MCAAGSLWAAPTQVLFVGNSFTFVNDLPATLRGLAQSFGDSVETDMAAKGAYWLRDHSRDPETLAKLKAKPWDFVVLQEQSQLPGLDDQQVERDVRPYALGLDSLVHADHAQTRTVFFSTWGRKSGDAQNCAAVPGVCTFDGQQERITRTYLDLAARTGAAIAPVGVAWQHVRGSHPEIELYQPDGIHPSAAGTYLAACVFYAALFHRGVLGASPLSLDPALARILQRAAQESVFSARP